MDGITYAFHYVASGVIAHSFKVVLVAPLVLVLLMLQLLALEGGSSLRIIIEFLCTCFHVFINCFADLRSGV